MSRKPVPRGFTLTELIVVMGIIILIIVVAIPAIRSLTGTRSVDAGYNTLAAVVTRAREEAVGIQGVRGVLFYLNPENDRVEAAIVMETAPPVNPPPGNPGANPPTYYLDVVPDRDYLTLPPGIGVQTVNNCTFSGTTRTSDGYLGFNPTATFGFTSTEGVRFGGVILFDGNGRLISKTYGFKLFDNTSGNSTGMATLLGLNSTPAPTTDLVPNNGSLLSSQFGFVLYDREAFKAQGYTDGDAFLDPAVSSYGVPATAGSEAAEETWLDSNSSPILVNRYNGTLIRAE